MSHEIESAVFMAAEGAGWTGLGRAIPLEIAADPAAIAALCNATWTVNTTPVYTKNADGTYSEANGFAAQVRSDNNHILSLTSDDKYHVEHRQPLDVFEAFRDKLAAHELDISHASVLRGGAVIAVSAILPSEFNVTVGRGDVLRSYVTLSTGYDKKHGTKATKGSIRVVCANTLAYSLAEAARTGKLRTVKASSHMDEMTLKDLIANVEKMVETERTQFNALANATMTDADVARYFADVLEVNIEDLHRVNARGEQIISGKTRNMLTALTSAYRSAPGAAVASGSLWGALNAVTYYATHEKTCRDTSGDGAALARIASNFSGDSARLKARALALASSRVAVAA